VKVTNLFLFYGLARIMGRLTCSGLFTVRELEYCRKGANSAQRHAARIAAKEAGMKALGMFVCSSADIHPSACHQSRWNRRRPPKSWAGKRQSLGLWFYGICHSRNQKPSWRHFQAYAQNWSLKTAEECWRRQNPWTRRHKCSYPDRMFAAFEA